MDRYQGEGGGPGYRNLIAWQRAIDLVEAVYLVTRDWPREELYGLTNQIRRAAVSVPSNIAEGRGRTSTREYAQHLSIAHGSLCEVETQLVIARRLGYIDDHHATDLNTKTAEVGRLLNGVMRSIRQGIQEEPTEYTPDS